MKKGFTCFALIALFSGLASTVNASTVFPLNKIIKSVAQESKNGKKMQANKYTDLSGTWHGSCDGIEETIVIENNEHEATIDGMSFDLKDVKTLSEIGNNRAHTVHFKLNWNEQGALIMRVLGFEKSFEPVSADLPTLSDYFTFASKLTFSLNNDKLVVDMESTNFSDDVRGDGQTQSMSCSYQKLK